MAEKGNRGGICHISRNLPLEGFKWEKNTSNFDKDFIRNYGEISNKGYILEVKLQQRFKSEGRNVYTEEISKIALIYNDDKRLQTSDTIASYPYGSSVGKIHKTEILSNYK